MKAMAMQGSSTEESYARNSAIQNHNFHAVAKPFLAKAVKRVVHNIVGAGGEQVDALSDCEFQMPPIISRNTDTRRRETTASFPRLRQHIAIADLGCSYGRNTLDCAQFVLQTLQQSWAPGKATRRNDDDDDDDGGGLEVQYFFCDLPSNDFNALFQSLSSITREDSAFLSKMKVAGVPGSFHGRLFPSASLDLVICSYSLHWLSQVPPSIVDRTSLAWNGGHTWTHQAPKAVLDAYALQSKIDVKDFLKSRVHELARGGILFLFLATSPMSTQENECSQSHRDSTWTIFDSAWKEMVDEGIITMEQMEMFNMPMYFFNEHEFKDAIIQVPELKLFQMKSLENTAKQETFVLHEWLGLVTSVTKPTVEQHLGEHKAHELFKKLKIIASQKKDFNGRFNHSLIVASLERL